MVDGRAREWLDAGSSFEWAPREPMGHVAKLGIFHAEFGDPEAPTLLLLHGFPTSSIDWYDVVETLGETYRVCVLDLPGFGFSDKPKGESYTLQRDAELVDHYLSEILGAGTVAVAAHDRGDSVALALAARCASGGATFELSHLLLSNGNMFLPLSNLNPFQRLVLDSSSAPEVLRAATPEAARGRHGREHVHPTAFPGRSRHRSAGPDVRVQRRRRGAARHDPVPRRALRARAGVARGAGPFAGPDDPRVGPSDVVSPLRVAAYVWDTYLATKPGANEFWLLPRANHYLQNDQPDEFAEVLTASFSQRSPEAPGPLSAAPNAPILVDRSRRTLPTAKDVLANEIQ